MSDSCKRKFQSPSFTDGVSDCIDYFEASDRERVYSIDRIAPDPYLDHWKSVPLTPKKSNLMKRVAAAFDKPDSFDIAVHVGNEVFNCIMLTLQCYSKFFKSRSRHEKAIILDTDKITPIVFQEIYEWILKSSKFIRREGLIPLLTGAQYLEIEMLEQQIWNLIQDGAMFQENEAFFLYLEAKYWTFDKIQSMMMHRVQRFFMTVVSTEEFLMMEASEIASWLQLDSIGVNSEVDVFYSACRWLLHDWDNRKDYLMDVMKPVRFGLIEPWKIVEYRLNKNTGKLKEILENVELQKQLESGLSYSTYRNCKDDSSEAFADFLSRFGMKRLFSRESSDEYWRSFCTNSTYTYENFEENLLNKLRSNAFANWNKLKI